MPNDPGTQCTPGGSLFAYTVSGHSTTNLYSRASATYTSTYYGTVPNDGRTIYITFWGNGNGSSTSGGATVSLSASNLSIITWEYYSGGGGVPGSYRLGTSASYYSVSNGGSVVGSSSILFLQSVFSSGVPGAWAQTGSTLSSNSAGAAGANGCCIMWSQ